LEEEEEGEERIDVSGGVLPAFLLVQGEKRNWNPASCVNHHLAID
jgi:hypothetical protein